VELGTHMLRSDLRAAFRAATGAPWFTALVALTIALGVGANAAIFSVVDAVLLQPLPFAHGDRLVSLWATNPDKTIRRFGVSYGDYLDWRTRTRSFTDMALYTSRVATMTTTSGPESVADFQVTRNFLDVLGVTPALGRGFGADDERGESSTTVILSYGFWQRRFGGDQNILSKKLSIDGRMRTVIGVLPANAALIGPAFMGNQLDVVTVVPFSSFPAVERHNQHLFGALARLKPGVTLAAASRDLYDTEVQIASENADIAGWTASVFMLSDDLSQGVRGPLLLLLAAAALVLLIACINVANLLLVRGTTRARELAVRQALGASRGRLVSQLLVESLGFGVVGGALGVLVAAGAIGGIRRMLPAGAIARAGDIHLDARVLAFAIALSMLSALLFGLWPAFRASTFSLNAVLRDGGRAQSGGVKSQRVRKSLVVAEVALAVVLVISAGLVVQSLQRLLNVDPGFRPEHAIAARITLTPERYPDSTTVAFYRQLLANLDGRAGIVAAGATDTPPLGGGGIFTPIRLVGQPPRPPDQPLMSTIRVVTPGFFEAAGMHVLAGTGIQWNEAGPSMVLSAAAAKAFWPNESVVGKQIAFGTEPRGLTVVGEVNDARETSLATPQGPVVYISFRRSMRYARAMTVIVRGTGDDASLVNALRAALREQDPTLALSNVLSLREIVNQSTAQTRLETLLLAVFAAAALLLSTLGIYGVVSYSVMQRYQEIGIRVALGAQRANVLRLVFTEGAVLACIGIAIGFAGALAATSLIQSWLFDIGRFDPLTFVATGCGLIVVSLAACWVPARRALRADPLAAMRAS